MPARISVRHIATSLALIAAPLTASAQTTGQVPSVHSSMPACTCQNLESLQQEYQNAVYLEGYMKALAEHLKTVEARQADMNANDPTNKDAGKSVNQASAEARDAYKAANLRLPFPKVTGYTGPEEVSMTPGTCKQPERQLAEMEGGSACAGISDALLAHELAHRDLCLKDGPDKYWSRPPSEIALEEAGMYKLQAANLKSELRAVLEASQVTLRGEWTHVYTGQGVEIGFYYEFSSGDLTGASSGGDRWSMSGTGETQNSITHIKIPEVSCTSTGAVRNSFAVTMDTDGLTFGLNYEEKNIGGDLVMTCNGGMSMAVPTGDAGSGQLAAGVMLKAGDNTVPNSWADQIVAIAGSNGMNVSGTPKTVLSVTCEKP